ncbi:ThuA domain-containing protein [Flagellimonas sp.]|jgi:type 1 glutamine amidotransferase|uniref:ThuA domain-containing protein n=1 Tax=Flagellimonas sp. TaxID=2058762 RepID=UPI000B68F50D|nr:MAG: ThuA domain-containing protein [Muricauda sp. TMED12]
MKQIVLTLIACCAVLQLFAQDKPVSNEETPKMPELVLVYTKTKGWRHKSIEKGVRTLRELGRQNGFIVIQSESGEDFTPQNLNNYKLVVFLNTTLDVLNNSQQTAFEGYIKGGGSFLGIHSACDTEYDWPWYGKLAGGYFNGHPNDPNVRKAKIDVVSKAHPSTAHLPDSWTRTDEWYNYKNLNPDVTVLLNLDESSYEGGTNGSNHPIAWYHEFDGGRSFYTGGGHTEDTYDEPMFRKHLLGAMEWCLKRK